MGCGTSKKSKSYEEGDPAAAAAKAGDYVCSNFKQDVLLISNFFLLKFSNFSKTIF